MPIFTYFFKLIGAILGSNQHVSKFDIENDMPISAVADLHNTLISAFLNLAVTFIYLGGH